MAESERNQLVSRFAFDNSERSITCESCQRTNVGATTLIDAKTSAASAIQPATVAVYSRTLTEAGSTDTLTETGAYPEQVVTCPLATKAS